MTGLYIVIMLVVFAIAYILIKIIRKSKNNAKNNANITKKERIHKSKNPLILLLELFDKNESIEWNEETKLAYNGFVGLVIEYAMYSSCSLLEINMIENKLLYATTEWKVKYFHFLILTNFDRFLRHMRNLVRPKILSVDKEHYKPHDYLDEEVNEPLDELNKA
jgi:hypothetical protein